MLASSVGKIANGVVLYVVCMYVCMYVCCTLVAVLHYKFSSCSKTYIYDRKAKVHIDCCIN